MSAFKDFLVNNLDLILSVVVVLASSIATLCGFKVSYNKEKNQLQIANAELAKAKAELEKAIIDGSYIICPHCGGKIVLKDVQIKVD